MIRAYQEGIDLHAITAASLTGISLAEVEALETTDKHRHTLLRTGGKAGNFGLLYCISAEGFQNYAWAVYGVKLTLPEAEAFRHRFLYEQWTGLPAYHDRQRALVQEQGWVRSALDRIRHLPTIWSWDRGVRAQAERQAINSPIQSTLSDMMLMAIAIIEAELPEVQIAIAIMTHFSAAGHVPIKSAEANLRDVVWIMSTLPLAELGWTSPLDFPADAEFGPDLTNLEPLAA